MKRGYTIVEVLIVVVIIGILAVCAIPGFEKFIRRAEMKEVRNMVDAVIAGAKHYELRHGTITTLRFSDPECWEDLNVEPPTDAVCTYSIVDGGGGIRILRVDTTAGTLYTYNLPRGPGTLNGSHPDARYAQDLP